MASGDRKFTRIPPESTGDRMCVHHHYQVNYNNKTGTFVIEDIITGENSGFSGQIVGITQLSGTTGILYVVPNPESEDLDVTVGEALSVNSVTQANVASAGYPIYVNTAHVIGWNNPAVGQFVDRHGQAYIRFAGGSMNFDAFGRARTSGQEPIAQYVFNYDAIPLQFSTEITGNATLAHDAISGAVVLTNTTGATDEVKFTSDLYHPYMPGVSQLVEMSIAAGDSGKANVERMWGLFDDNNGLFFKQTETDLQVVIRNNTSGTVVETAVSRANWNGDQCDGENDNSNLSGFNLDTSKDIVYWIDFQWLGAGKVRFGCYGKGLNIVMHEFYNSGDNLASYMRVGSLPIRVQQTNTSATGSSSELRLFCATVMAEVNRYTHPPRIFNLSIGPVSIPDNETYLFSIRSKASYNSVDNRTIALIKKLIYSVVNNSTPTQEDRVLLKFWLNTPLTDPNWTNVSDNSTVEYDVNATLGTHVLKISERYLKGTGEIDISLGTERIDTLYRILKKADGTQPTLTVTAQNMDSGNTASAYLTTVWQEVNR